DARGGEAGGDLGHEPRGVARLEDVAHLGPGAEGLEEAVEPGEVDARRGRELPDDGDELVAELGGRAAQAGDRARHVAQPLEVGDEAVALGGEAEAGGRLLAPAAVGLGAELAVEAAVDLERVDLARDVREPG